MPKSEGAKTREQRLAAKLRENLKRRKVQVRARGVSGSGTSGVPPSDAERSGKG